MRLKRRYLLVLFVMVVGALLPSPAAAASAPVLVNAGFDNPRGVAFFHGQLLVAEAGHGGKNCIVAPGEPTACFGRTGKISSVATHAALVDHLFALTEAFGPNPDSLGLGGLSAHGGKLMAIEGIYPQLFKNYKCAPADGECEADLAAAKKEAGALLAVSHDGTFRVVANVGAHDFDFTATVGAPQEHDSNPYGVLAVPGGSFVADAGSNTLNFVSNGGHDSIVHYFPWRNPNPMGFPSDEVPTCVAITESGLYVASLSGHLYRVHGGSATQIPNSDLKHVTGCTTDQDENIYFVNMWNAPFPTPGTGNIVKFKSDEGTSSVIADHLNFPNMDTVGPDGNLYFSADSVCPNHAAGPVCPLGGTVWKLALPGNNGDGDHQG
jgi:hypothetical protein